MSTTTAPRTPMETRGVPVDEARYRLGNLGKTHFYNLVRQGKIRVVRLGRRTIVPLSEIDRLLRDEGDDA